MRVAPTRRWKERVSGQGAEWTKKNKPCYLAHYEECASRQEATARQKGLKKTAGRNCLKRAIVEGRTRHAGGVPFAEKMACLSALWRKQRAEAARPDAAMTKNLDKQGYEGWFPRVIKPIHPFA